MESGDFLRSSSAIRPRPLTRNGIRQLLKDLTADPRILPEELAIDGLSLITLNISRKMDGWRHDAAEHLIRTLHRRKRYHGGGQVRVSSVREHAENGHEPKTLLGVLRGEPGLS